MFLTLCPSLPLSLRINKIFKKKRKSSKHRKQTWVQYDCHREISELTVLPDCREERAGARYASRHLPEPVCKLSHFPYGAFSVLFFFSHSSLPAVTVSAPPTRQRHCSVAGTRVVQNVLQASWRRHRAPLSKSELLKGNVFNLGHYMKKYEVFKVPSISKIPCY